MPYSGGRKGHPPPPPHELYRRAVSSYYNEGSLAYIFKCLSSPSRRCLPRQDAIEYLQMLPPTSLRRIREVAIHLIL